MDVLEAIRQRRTVRKYKNEPVHEQDMEKLLEAARLAPSGMNLQPWELVVVTKPDQKFLLMEACNNQPYVAEAGAVICGIDDPKAKWASVDLALAMENMVLEATELGLGCCFIGAFSEIKVKKVLCIPEDRHVVMLLTVGIPDEKPGPAPKKPLKKLAHWERHGGTR
jgi:nitroreductase